MFKAFLQQCEGEVLSTQRKKNKSRATVAGEVLERTSEPSPTTDSLQHIKGISSRKVSGHSVDPGYESKRCLYRGGAGNKFIAKTWRTFLTNHNRSSGRRFEKRVLESIGQSISVQKREGERLSKNVKENSKLSIERKAIFSCLSIFFKRSL